MCSCTNILHFLVTCVYGGSAIYDMLSSIILSLRIKGFKLIHPLEHFIIFILRDEISEQLISLYVGDAKWIFTINEVQHKYLSTDKLYIAIVCSVEI